MEIYFPGKFARHPKARLVSPSNKTNIFRYRQKPVKRENCLLKKRNKGNLLKNTSY